MSPAGETGLWCWFTAQSDIMAPITGGVEPQIRPRESILLPVSHRKDEMRSVKNHQSAFVFIPR